MDNLLGDHPEIQQLRAMSRSIREMRSALERLESARDAAIRRLDAEGVIARTALARELGMTRGRIWQIINPAWRSADDAADPDVDVELLEFADELWERAVDAWHDAGAVGSPDDFFPVDAVLHRD